MTMEWTVKCTDICEIDTPYAIEFLQLKEGTVGICASNVEGESCLFNPDQPAEFCFQNLDVPNRGAQVFKQESEDSYYAVQGFLPQYQCEDAGIVLVSRQDEKNWKVDPCFKMPFVHKFTTVRVGEAQYMLCATLSGPKKFLDDWSIPGKVLISRIPDDQVNGDWDFEPLISPMTKNHGFCEVDYLGEHLVIFTAHEGVFAVHVPAKEGGPFRVEQMLEHEVGDIFAVVEGRKLRLATINGFHGNEAASYLWSRGSKPVKEFSFPVDYGHAAWTGEFEGSKMLAFSELNGSGRFMIFILDGGEWKQLYCEENIGGFGLKARCCEDRLQLLCPSRIQNKVKLYEISKG